MTEANLQFERLLSQAKATAQAANWTAAEKLYDSARQLDPRNFEVLLGLVQCRRTLGKLAEARDMLECALYYHPGNFALRVEGANIELADKRFETALELFDELLTSEPGVAALCAGKLKCLLTLQRTQEFTTAVEDALAAFPEEPSILTQCGLMHLRLRQFATGIEMFIGADNRVQLIECIGAVEKLEDEALLKEVQLRLPRQVSVLREVAQAYIRLKQYPPAAQVLGRLLEIDPTDEAARTDRFETLKKAGLFKEARELAESMIQESPEEWHARLYLAELRWMEDGTQNVLDLLRSPSEFLALLKMNSGGRDHSRLLDCALKQWKGDVRLLLLSARDKAKQQSSYLSAETLYREILRKVSAGISTPAKGNIQPEQSRTLKVLKKARLELIGILKRMDRIADANTEAKAALGDNPGDTDFLNEVADIALKEKHFQFAAELWLDPPQQKMIANAADTLCQEGDFRGAVKLVRLALEKRHNDLDLLVALGKTYYTCQEYEEASKAYRMAVFEGVLSSNQEKASVQEISTDPEAASAQVNNQDLRRKSIENVTKQSALSMLIYLLRAQGKITEADQVLSEVNNELKTGNREVEIEIAWLEYSRPNNQEYGRVNNYVEALSRFEKLYNEHRSDRAYIASGKAFCLRRLHSRDTAIQFIDEILSADQDLEGRLVIIKSQLLFEKGELEAALACSREAREDHILNGYLMESDLLRYLKRSDEANELLEVALTKFESAPDRLLINAQRAWIKTVEGNFAEASDLVEQIPEFGGAALKWSSLGSIYFAQRDYSKAAEYFEKALEAELPGAPSHCNLALAIVRQVEDGVVFSVRAGMSSRFRQRVTKLVSTTSMERHDLAESQLEQAANLCLQALVIDSTSAQAYACLGEIERRRRNLKAAEDWYLKSIQENKAEGDHTGLGALYLEIGREQDAEQTLKTACLMNSRDARARIELSNVYFQTRRNRLALNTLKEAFAIEPSNETVVRALGMAYQREGRLSEAVEILQDAIGTLAEDKCWRLHLALAEVFAEMAEKMKDKELYSKALDEIREAMSLQANSPEVNFCAGVVNYKVGDFDRARGNFESCLDFEKYKFSAERNIKKIQAIRRELLARADFSREFGIGLALFSSIGLVVLWILYLKQTNMRITSTMVTTLSPTLLGTAVLGFILPYINKFKLPGVEAELIRKEPISMAPPPPSIDFGTVGIASTRR